MVHRGLFTFIFLFIFAAAAFSGTTGKISGKVTDAESGMPLPGVNVMVEGTTFGAATDIDGNYVILNLTPGLYSLKMTMIGYAAYRIEEVRVIIDQTTRINARLKSVVLTGEEVVVVANRSIVQKDVSNSQMNMAAKRIENMPVKSVKEVLTLQAGIEQGSEGIIVRGGSANQTAFMVDGLSLNDERSNLPYTAVSLSSIREVQIQTGGFNAEYGNVRSGLVNIVTKEGSKEKYTATASVQYSPAAPKNFGPSVYAPSSYFNRPYLDPEVCWTGTNNGAWDQYTQQQYPIFEGWDAVSFATLSDNDPGNDLTPLGAKRLYEWQHRRQGDIKKPDYVIDVGFGGPVPVIGSALGGLRFFLTHYREQNMFVVPLSRDHYGENHTQLKLTADISPSIKLTATALYGEVHSVSPYNWTTTPTGRVLTSQDEIANLVNNSSVLYMPGYYSPSSIYRTLMGIKLTHILSKETFYELSIQNNFNRYNTYQMSVRDTTKKYSPLAGYFVDEAPFGYWGYGVTGIDGMSMGGWMNLGRDKSVNSTFSLRFDLTSQIDVRNQVKAGFQVVYNDFNIKSTTESPSMGTWTRSMLYHVFPYRISSYLQNKLEFQGFIANVGARLDYYDPNTTMFDLTVYDKYLTAGSGNNIESEVDTRKAKTSFTISPRLGVSHPITENSKLYFNYGHFYSEPTSSNRFRLQRESNGSVTFLGNPSLIPEKTVAYELGYEHSLFNLFVLNIAAYYKDVSNQSNWIRYVGLREVNYLKAANNNYADIRGVEITLNKRIGKYVSGFVNYTYDVQTSGYFGLTRYYEDPTMQRNELMRNQYQSKPRPRPYARANINFHTPEKFGFRWRDFYPLENWNLNLIADWKTGRYDTYNPHNIPGIFANVQWKDWHNLDLRIAKLFRLGRYNFQFYLDVHNALNTKYMSYAGFSSYRDDYLPYLESLNFPWETGEEKGNDLIGEYRPENVAYDPLEANPYHDPVIKARNDERKRTKAYINNPDIKALTFLNPRDIVFGVKIHF